jgi:hypothetical protein
MSQALTGPPWLGLSFRRNVVVRPNTAGVTVWGKTWLGPLFRLGYVLDETSFLDQTSLGPIVLDKTLLDQTPLDETALGEQP